MGLESTTKAFSKFAADVIQNVLSTFTTHATGQFLKRLAKSSEDEIYAESTMRCSNFSIDFNLNPKTSAFGVNSQIARQKPPKSPNGEIATRHQTKFCWKLNSKWKNGIALEIPSTQSKVRRL